MLGGRACSRLVLFGPTRALDRGDEPGRMMIGSVLDDDGIVSLIAGAVRVELLVANAVQDRVLAELESFAVTIHQPITPGEVVVVVTEAGDCVRRVHLVRPLVIGEPGGQGHDL